MVLKVFLIAVVLLAISMLGIGLKILFNKTSKQQDDNCANDSGQTFGCGCGGGFCENISKHA